MRELSLRVEDPKININGHVFALLLSDLELFTRVQALLDGFGRFAREAGTAAEALAAANEANALLEAALGAGAANIIGGGKPVSVSLLVEWLAALAEEAAGHYTELALAEEEVPAHGG